MTDQDTPGAGVPIVDPRTTESGALPSSVPVTTRVLWSEVTGNQLEELLYGLLGAMGASSLVWRAGSDAGVTAPDGGRDLEATFDRPDPDGQLDRQRWWVECKGRSGTVERAAVQQALLDASAQSSLDVLVVATNSRFSNPTRDWVSDFQLSHHRPTIRLWDRDNLDRLVHQYPTVAARVLPDALSDDDRLDLLVNRFERLGEEPTEADKGYFWERREWMRSHDRRYRALAMFLYSEGESLPRKRAWWTLVRDTRDSVHAIVTATIAVPALLGSNTERARPLDRNRCLAAAARLLMAAFASRQEESSLVRLTLNPWSIVIGGEEVSENQAEYAAWLDGGLAPILAWLASDLLGPCSMDCARVNADNPHEIESLNAKEFWRHVYEGESGKQDGVLVLESLDDTQCTVELDVETHGCPLITSNRLPLETWISQLAKVIAFRGTRPNAVQLGGLAGCQGVLMHG